MDFKVGDTVYYIEAYGYIGKGTINCFIILDNVMVGARIDNYSGGTARDFDKMFKTEKEAIIRRNQDKEDTKNEYRSMIVDADSLIRFMFEHKVCCCEEYTDWEARWVVEEKAKELLGIELDY